jgi:hypothetical protein
VSLFLEAVLCGLRRTADSSGRNAKPPECHPADYKESAPNTLRRRIGRLSLDAWSVDVADWAGFGHYICHDLASLLTGTMPFVYQNVPDARECNKATC